MCLYRHHTHTHAHTHRLKYPVLLIPNKLPCCSWNDLQSENQCFNSIQPPFSAIRLCAKYHAKYPGRHIKEQDLVPGFKELTVHRGRHKFQVRVAGATAKAGDTTETRWKEWTPAWLVLMGTRTQAEMGRNRHQDWGNVELSHRGPGAQGSFRKGLWL